MADGRGQMSRIQQLDDDLKELLDRLLRSGVTQRDILDRLNPLLTERGDQPLSRSGLNRYTQKMERVGRRIRESREIAGAWVSKFGEQPTGELSQIVIEMLRTMAFDLAFKAHEGLDADDGDEAAPAVDASMIGELALAVQRMERSSAISADRERKVRAEVREEAADAAATEAKAQGVPSDICSAIREVVQGRSG